jgi:HlyD family secretion protein
MKKWYWLGGLLILAAGSLWLLKGTSQPSAATMAFVPQTEKVKRGDLSVIVSATGIIQPINKVEIKSKASGQIEELKIEESDLVDKNDLIARLDQKDTKNSYDQAVADLDVAEANLKQAKSDFQRSSELYDKGLISAAEFDQARLAVVQANAQLVRARINLDNSDIRLKETVVRSPITGIILTKNVEVGQIISSGISNVSGGTLIATVADMKEVYVKADVDEVDIGEIQAGMEAKVTADAYPNQLFKGKVLRIAAQSKVTQNVTTFEVTILVNNPGGLLKAGMNASVEILIADKKNVLLIPNEALMTRADLMQEMSKLRFALGSENQGPRADGRPGGGRPEGGRRRQMEGASAQPAEPRGEGRPRDGSGMDNENLRRGVILKHGSEFHPRMVETGVANFDNTEVISGLQEGDEVMYTFFSRAKQASDQFRQRMSQMNGMNAGFRNQSGTASSSPGAGARPR